MKVVDLKTFLEYPSGAVFAEYRPMVMGDIEIRGDVWVTEKDKERLNLYSYHSATLFSPSEELNLHNETLIETDVYYRNGPGLKIDQLFVIFDKADLSEIIQRLQRAREEAKE
jgi:hypothetical protein